jgi:hypothetical protein
MGCGSPATQWESWAGRCITGESDAFLILIGRQGAPSSLARAVYGEKYAALFGKMDKFYNPFERKSQELSGFAKVLAR